MLRIRPEQMEIFARAQRTRFEDDACAHVAEHWPAVLEARGETEVRELVEHVSTRADQLGIEAEYDILRLLNLHCAFGAAFEESEPWAAEILSALERPGRDRLDEVMARASEAASPPSQRT